MPDPVTIGAFVVAALTKGAESGLTKLATTAITDGYAALKAKVGEWVGGKVEVLEAAPDSERVRGEVAALIDARDAPSKDMIRQLADALVEAMEHASNQKLIAIDIGVLRAARVSLRNLDVTAGTALKAREVDTPGDFTIENLRVGPGAGKPQ